MKVVLASGNKGKLNEFNQLLASLNMEVLPQSDFNVASVEETGLTFVENAILKARYASKISGLPAIADDSGLEVDALKGLPGIYSARYAGEAANDAANNEKLLRELTGVKAEDRTARFQCVLVYLEHPADPTPIICQGSWEGVILEAPAGEQGFGYDPLFWVPSKQCASAELDRDEKNRLSHRGKALGELINKLRDARHLSQ
ncbi:XTP/dITP diphosphatase [Alkalimarinus sediminis]|uniref:dITP/XTP pyrophosphatase n=1 Tax=Alkalimarinus sediminis TaxID=1632866 RepID=A0A9E8HJG3_9ALTE|nr:XTP/dITP diphosphatase [Alkalimarinus sediminis]UZW75287.1 XTP/dITP diphosphatase [Alkalimarinus sediminis]